MPTPSEDRLKQAYEALRIPHGSPWSEIKDRYKTLAKLLHPDKHTNEKDKNSAESEFKFFNEHYDVLRQHFSKGGEHVEEGFCICRGSIAPSVQSQNSASSPAPSPSKKGDEISTEPIREPVRNNRILVSLLIGGIAVTLLILFAWISAGKGGPTILPPEPELEYPSNESMDKGNQNNNTIGNTNSFHSAPDLPDKFQSISQSHQRIRDIKHDIILTNKELRSLKSTLRTSDVAERVQLQSQITKKEEELEKLKAREKSELQHLKDKTNDVGTTDRVKSLPGSIQESDPDLAPESLRKSSPSSMPPLIPKDTSLVD